MSFREYARVFIKRWWLILLVALVASGGAYAASKLQQPLFRSTLKIYVAPARPDYGNVLTINELIRQYGQLIQSDRILQQVIDNLRLDLKPEALRTRLSSSGTRDNQAILLTVDDPDSGQAPRIATAVAQTFLQDHSLRMQNVTRSDQIDLLLYDKATPSTLFRPQTRLNVLAGAIFGLVLGTLLVFLLEYLDDTLKTPEDVERILGIPVVGRIPTLGPGEGPALAPRVQEAQPHEVA